MFRKGPRRDLHGGAVFHLILSVSASLFHFNGHASTEHEIFVGELLNPLNV
jgi:hypothetical protein